MKILKLIWKFPLLMVLAVSQAVLKVLNKLTGIFTGLLTPVLVGFWIHHCLQENWENVILLSFSRAVCIGLPVLLRTTDYLLRALTEKIK